MSTISKEAKETAMQLRLKAMPCAWKDARAADQIIQAAIDQATAAMVAERDHWQSEALNLRKLGEEAVRERMARLIQALKRCRDAMGAGFGKAQNDHIKAQADAALAAARQSQQKPEGKA